MIRKKLKLIQLVYTIIKTTQKQEKVLLSEFYLIRLETASEFISDHFPTFTFPLVFYHSIERQKEAQAAYTAIVVSHILNLKFKETVEDLIKHYHFNKLRHKEKDSMYFDFREIFKKLRADNKLKSKL